MVFLFTVVTSPFVVPLDRLNNVKRAVIGAILQYRFIPSLHYMAGRVKMNCTLFWVISLVLLKAKICSSLMLVKIRV